MKTVITKFFWVVFFNAMCLTLVSQSPTKLTGALGLTFGINKAKVKEIIVGKGGILKETKINSISFSNVKMGTQNSDILLCKVVNDKLFEIVAIFAPSVEARAQELYDEIKNIIESKYGKGESFRSFKGIYTDGDGYEMQAIKTGNATIATYWTNFENKNGIVLEIVGTERLVFIKLSYQDGLLIEEAIKIEDSKNAVEF